MHDGTVACDELAATSVPGIFAAGNILQGVQLSIVAAGDGARAAWRPGGDPRREKRAQECWIAVLLGQIRIYRGGHFSHRNQNWHVA
jgi:pyruvate/2-oxoglutarate dehydrogenase complex dihydrolipoamide dehydrogenase (E3) component